MRFREQMLTSVNLRESVTFSCAGESNLAQLTLVEHRLVRLHEICLVEMEVGLRMAVAVESLRYFREGTGRRRWASTQIWTY